MARLWYWIRKTVLHKAKGKVVFVVDGGVACRITAMGIDDTTDNENVRESE